MRFFLAPIVVSILALFAVLFFGGVTAFFTAALLVLLEVTLSFDNAVVNAKVLVKMNEVWQRRFMTWGIAVAVVGTRLVLPIIIVSAAAWVSPLLVARLALFDPAQYATLLGHAHELISAFGGTFLMMVAAKYFLDSKKDVHWIHAIERHLAKWGRFDAIEIFVGLITLLTLSFLVPEEARALVLTAGIVGVALFILMEGIVSAFSVETSSHGSDLAKSSLAFFIYLEVLDAAFSLDGVVGAFALTNSIPAIAVGLGLGAYFVRSITLYLVQHHALDSLRYLEHGAHWAIFGLSASMFASLLFEVPEIVTGTVGIAFVSAAYYSSLRFNKKAPA